MDRDVACCCSFFFGLPFLISIIMMISLALKTCTPTGALQDLYIPALNTRLSSFNSSTFIFFDVELDNVIEKDGVSYDYVGVTVAFYYGRKTGLPIANYTVPGFDQGGEETTHLRDVVETSGMPWWDACAVVSGGSAAAFRVELTARVKVNRDVGHSGEKELLMLGDVEVNGYGETVQNKAIKLIALL